MTDFWQNDPVAQHPASDPSQFWTKDPVLNKSPGMAWSDVASGAIRNAPASAVKFGEDLVAPILHPVQTAQNLYHAGAGALDMAAAATNAAVDPYLPKSAQVFPEKTFGERYERALSTSDPTNVGAARAVGQSFADRYGGLENIKRTIATDPVGVLGDAAAALTLGGEALARAPSIAGRAGEAVRSAGNAINPMMGPAKLAGAAGDEYKRLTRPISAPSTEDLYDAADAAYHDKSIKELVVKPKAFQDWKEKAVLDLNQDGFNSVLSPKSFGVLGMLDDVPAGGFVTGQTFDTLRRTLKKAAASTDPTEAETARQLIGSLDNFLGNIPRDAVIRGNPASVKSALTEARGNYAAAKRSDQIDDALQRADRQAGAANSGMNLDNATRQRVKDILNSAKKRRGFNDEEIAQMEAIVKGSPLENVSRRLGNMLGGGGGLGTTLVASGGAAVGASGGGAVGAALGALSPVVGYGFKKLSAAMSRADVNKLQELVRSRSPLGQQMQSSLSKFGKASVTANGSPTPQNIAKLLLASRNLSSNLSDAGMNVSEDDIIRGIASSATPSRGNVTVTDN